MFPDLRIIALIGALAFAGGYTVADWRLTGKATAAALERLQHAEKTRDEAIAAYEHLAGALNVANDQHLSDLKKAQNETIAIRNRLGAGSIGLRVAGNCPRLGDAQAAPGSRVDTGTGAELDATARRAYFALREGIDQAAAQLAACQDQLKLRYAP